MEPRQTRRIFVLSAAVVAVTLALWLDPPPAAPARIEVFTPEPALDRVEIVREDGGVVLVRRGDAWWVGGTVEQPADEPEVRRLLDAIRGLRYADPVAVSSEADPEDFGLGEEPWATLHLDGPGGRQTIVLGDPAEVGFRSYVRGPGGEVLVARAGPHALVGRPASAFADRRLVAWAPEQIASASVSGAERALTVRRRGRSWVVADQWRGDPERVAAWLRVWSSIRIGEGSAPSNPEWSLVVTPDRGEPLRVDVALDGTRALVAASDGRLGAATLEPTLLELTPEMLAASTLLGLDRSTADRVSVDLNGETWEGRRNGPAWESSLGDGASWDVVTALAELPQVDPESPRRSPPPRPWGTITVVEDGFEHQVVLDRARRGIHLAWQPSATRPVGVPASAVSDVLRELGVE